MGGNRLEDDSNEDWDTDAHFDPILPPDQWALKKAFIEAHKARFPKYRLLSLANTFMNMEFMGARYIPDVEKQINILSNEVSEIKQYRNGRRNFLKRTFVAASDATRSKLMRTDLEIPKSTNIITQPKKNITESSTSFQSIAGSYLSQLSDENFELLEKVRNQKGVRGKIVFFVHPQMVPYSIIMHSTGKAKLKLVLKDTGTRSKEDLNLREYKILIDDEEINKGFAKNEKNAREILGTNALKLLQETCFSIIVKSHLKGENINKEDAITEKKNEPNILIPENNKGAQMMRKMGWTGTGLGKNKDGIEKPVEANRNVCRMGLSLDFSNLRKTREIVGKLLHDYVRDGDTANLVFSADYTNAERKVIHEMAQKLDLKSKSYGKNEERQLVVSKKKETWTLVTELLSCGGENDNYKLQSPTKIT